MLDITVTGDDADDGVKVCGIGPPDEIIADLVNASICLLRGLSKGDPAMADLYLTTFMIAMNNFRQDILLSGQ